MASEEILIIQTAFIGDAVLTIPLIVNTQRLYPNAKINLLCRKGLGGFFGHLNLVHKTFEFDKSNSKSWSLVSKALKSMDFDLVVCPHESTRSQLLVWQLKGRQKIGYKKWWNKFVFHKTTSRALQYPEVIRQNLLLSLISEDHKKKMNQVLNQDHFKNPLEQGDLEFNQGQEIPDFLKLKLPLGEILPLSLQNEADHLLKNKGIEQGDAFVALVPGSVWETKKWPVENYIRLAQKLSAQGERVVLFGSPGETFLCTQIAEAASEQIVNLCGQTSLIQMAHLFRQAKTVFCNDSGSMHIAALAGAPIIAFFGPTVLELGYRPWSEKSVVIQNKLTCRPCGLHGSHKCPIGTHECMKASVVNRPMAYFNQQFDRQ